jgi:hexosaminidase
MMKMTPNATIVPRPLKQEERKGFFESDCLPEIEGDTCFLNEIAVFREQMAARFAPTEGNANGAAAIRANSAFKSPARIFCTKLDDGAIGEEAYKLSVSPQRIDLSAAAGAGIYNGLQSLRQLFLSACSGDAFDRNPAAHFSVPCLEIEDSPRFPWRGFMLDCSRHFYHVQFIKKIIDVLSMHHINRFHWHLTDDQGWRLPVPEYPLLIEIGSKRRNPHRQEEIFSDGSYTEAEILEVVDFAEARHVTLVPEVDLPGHTVSALAAYPELGCTGGPYDVEYRFGVFDDILCAGNDGIFNFAGAVFDSLARLFPGKYVHIGGDEAPTARWEACPICQKRITELKLSEARQLQRWLTRRFTLMLAERGKTAIGWDEVLEGVDSSGHTALPDELMVMYWRSWENMDKQPLVEAAAQGRRLIMTPCTHGAYLNCKQSPEPDTPGAGDSPATLRDSYTIPLTLPGMTDEQSKMVIGGQGNLWGELINSDKNAEYLIFPRICALAEAFWTHEGFRDFDDFCMRLPPHQKRLDSLGFLQFREPGNF